MKVFDNITELIGNTPLVKINKLKSQISNLASDKTDYEKKLESLSKSTTETMSYDSSDFERRLDKIKYISILSCSLICPSLFKKIWLFY